MLNIIISIFFILHGLIHLIGFVVPWRIITTDEMPYKTTLLAGRVDVGDVGIKIIGIFWILGAVGFVVAGIGLWTLAPWWFGVTLGATLYSLVLCILGWPDAQFGVYINLIILAYLFFGGRLGWLP